MNFLSHYYFTQNKHDPYFTLGSVLPDLIRNYRDDWRIRPENEVNKFNKNSELISLIHGWNLHLHVDRVFHSSDFFHQQTSALRKSLVLVFRRLPIRPFFLAHVGYELTLDRLLIHNKLIKTDQFYQELASCDPYIIKEFLKISGIKEPSGFLGFLNSFIKANYLESYHESKSIVYALDRIGRRVWNTSFNENEIKESILIFEKLKETLNPTFIEIFDHLENSLES